MNDDILKKIKKELSEAEGSFTNWIGLVGEILANDILKIEGFTHIRNMHIKHGYAHLYDIEAQKDGKTYFLEVKTRATRPYVFTVYHLNILIELAKRNKSIPLILLISPKGYEFVNPRDYFGKRKVKTNLGQIYFHYETKQEVLDKVTCDHCTFMAKHK